MTMRTAAILAACAGLLAAQDAPPAAPKPGPEHGLLARFEGEWDCEFEACMAPDQPPVKSKGTLTGRRIGGFWAVVAVTGEMGGVPYTGQGTFGYDSKTKRYVGVWADSMSEHFWKYDGSADAGRLALDSQGPNPEDPARLIQFRDTWDLSADGRIVLASEVEGPDGKMMKCMKMTCTRRK